MPVRTAAFLADTTWRAATRSMPVAEMQQPLRSAILKAKRGSQAVNGLVEDYGQVAEDI
jgi:hypothetical protein